MKIGLISDTHIPRRAKEIPKEFLEWFKQEKVELIIHCGDLNDPKILNILEDIAEVKVVRGNTDYLDLPKELILRIGKYKVFVFHSSEIYPRGDLEQIYQYALSKNANIAIFGHTHLPLFTVYNNVFMINPGSATGVRSGEINVSIKSCAILEIKDEKINVKFKIF